MASDVIEVHYSELEAVARRFRQQANASSELQRRVRRAFDALQLGGWVGEGSEAFCLEMTDRVLPALERLSQALTEGDRVTLEIAREMERAEQEAAQLFQTDGPGTVQVERPDTSESEKSTLIPEAAEYSGSEPKSQVIEDEYSSDRELVRDVTKGLYFAKKGSDLLKDFDTAQVSKTVGNMAEAVQESIAPDFIARGVTKGTDEIQKSLYLTDGERIRAIANSTAVRAFGAATGGFFEGETAAERGVSDAAAVINGAVVGAINYWGLPGASPIEAAVGIVNAVTSSISPETGEYTKIVADTMPSDVAKKIAMGAIDTVDALVRGDEKQLIRHHEQNLSGQYGEMLRGYAIGAEAIGSVVMGDQDALNRLSDAAAGGKLGKLAQFGDWLGGVTFDVIHDR